MNKFFKVLSHTVFLLSVCFTMASHAKDANTKFDTKDIASNIEAWVKLDGDTSGKVVYRLGSLIAYGMPAAEFSQALFELVSIKKIVYRKLDNGDYVSQYWACGLYADPATGEFIKEFKNPYTDETIKVKPYCSNISGLTYSVEKGMSARANFDMQSTVFDKPFLLDWKIVGDVAVVNQPASTIWHEKSSGKTKVETTIGSYTAKFSDIIDPNKTSVDNAYQYTLATEWMTMLKMGDRLGSMLWLGHSTKHSDVNTLPADIVAEFKSQLGDDVLSKELVWDEGVADAKKNSLETIEHIMSLWPGHYNNKKQIASLEANGKPIWREDADGEGKGGHVEIESYYRAVDLPQIGEHVLYLEELKHGKPDAIFRQRLYTLHVDAQDKVQVKLWYFNDKKKYVGAWQDTSVLKDLKKEDMFALDDSCDLEVNLQGKKYHMAMIDKACVFGDRYFNYQVLLDENSFWFRDKINSSKTDELLESVGNFTYHELDRLEK